MIHAHSRNGLGYYGYNWSDGSLVNPLLYAGVGEHHRKEFLDIII